MEAGRQSEVVGSRGSCCQSRHQCQHCLMVLLSLFHCHHGIVSLYSLPQDAESPQYNLDTNALAREDRVCEAYIKVSTNALGKCYK